MRAAISTRHRYDLAERNKGKSFTASVTRTQGVNLATVFFVPHGTTAATGFETNLDEHQITDLRDMLSEVLEDWSK